MKTTYLLFLPISLFIVSCVFRQDNSMFIDDCTDDCCDYWQLSGIDSLSTVYITLECDCDTTSSFSILSRFRRLESLSFDCDKNRFDELPRLGVTRLETNVLTPNILSLPSVEVLITEDEIIEEVKELFRLRVIMASNVLTFPENFENKTLDRFSLYYVGVAYPETLYELSNLTELSINKQSTLITLSEDIGNLSNLSWLTFGDSTINNIPQGVSQLAELKHFILRGNSNVIIPDVFENLTKLYRIELSDRTLTTAEFESILKAENLGKLSLEECPFDSIPQQILDLQPTLKSLRLNDCGLDEIPKKIGALTNLEWLYFDNNGLTTFPDELFNLKDGLQYLMLRGNNFSEAEQDRIKANFPDTEVRFRW